MLSFCGTVVVVVVALAVLQTSSGQEGRCPKIKCDPGCVLTSYTGMWKRCPSCECPPSCKGINCVDGYICELQTIECSKEPCYPLPRCVRAPVTLKTATV